MLEVNSYIQNDVLVVDLVGRLDGITSKIFTEKTSEPSQIGISKIVLDCKELNYISSEGLRVILMAAKRAKSSGGALTLCRVNPSVNEVMVISGFGALLGVHPDLEKAISAIS